MKLRAVTAGVLSMVAAAVWAADYTVSGQALYDLAGNQIIVENDRMQLRLFISSPDPAGAELLEHLEKTDLNSFGEEEI